MASAKLDYALPTEPVASARRFEEIVDAKSDRGGWGPNSLVTFDIPTGQKNTYLDPSRTYLEFTLQNLCTDAGGTNSRAAQLDGNGYAVVKKIQLFDRPGGTELENVENANALYNVIANATTSAYENRTYGGVTEGYMPNRRYMLWGQVRSDAGTTLTNNWAEYHIMDDVDFQGNYFNRTTATSTDSNEQTLSSQTLGIQLMSVIGALGHKYVPVHALNRPLRVTLTTADATEVFTGFPPSLRSGTTANTTQVQTYQPFIANDLQSGSENSKTNTSLFPNADTPGIFNYALQDVRLHIGYVQIPDDAQRAVDAATGGKYTWCDTSYRAYRNTLAKGVLQQSLYIPAHLSSARHALTVFRREDLRTNANSRYTSCFPRYNINSAQYFLGQQPMPRRPMQSVAAMAKNYLGCFDWSPARTRIAVQNYWANYGTYNVDLVTTPVGVGVGTAATFCIGIDLGGPCGDEFNYFMGGANTLGTELRLDITAASALPTTLTFADTFICHDMLFTIDEYGNLTVSI